MPRNIAELRNLCQPGITADPDGERRRRLSAFLVERRSRIDPAIAVLGEYIRRAEVIGDLVSPHEIADASNVSRRWYELAERGEPTRATAAVLHALGKVLALHPREQNILVRLATPSVARDTPREESLEVRDAFGPLRDFLRKLNACSTTDELLSLVEDTAASYFPEASYLTTYSRGRDGGWSYHGEAMGAASRLPPFAYNRREVVAPTFALDPIASDLITGFPQLSLPGDFITYESHDETMLAAVFGKGFPVFKKVHEASLASVIRSREGFVAHLLVGDFLRIYGNDVDIALVAAIVDFASLAASR
jgi:hypothetical protein